MKKALLLQRSQQERSQNGRTKSWTTTSPSPQAVSPEISGTTLRLLAASNSKMDGPYVPYAPADAFSGSSIPYLTYHVAQAGFSFISPIGAVIGAIVPSIAKTRVTRIQSIALGSLIAGGAGALLGVGGLVRTAYSDSNKVPWNDEGIQQRVDGLSYNYHVRAVDMGSAIGAGVGLFARTAFIPPTALSVPQAMALGVVLGSIGANGFVLQQKRSEAKEFEQDDEDEN